MTNSIISLGPSSCFSFFAWHVCYLFRLLVCLSLYELKNKEIYNLAQNKTILKRRGEGGRFSFSCMQWCRMVVYFTLLHHQPLLPFSSWHLPFNRDNFPKIKTVFMVLTQLVTPYFNLIYRKVSHSMPNIQIFINYINNTLSRAQLAAPVIFQHRYTLLGKMTILFWHLRRDASLCVFKW